MPSVGNKNWPLVWLPIMDIARWGSWTPLKKHFIYFKLWPWLVLIQNDENISWILLQYIAFALSKCMRRDFKLANCQTSKPHGSPERRTIDNIFRKAPFLSIPGYTNDKARILSVRLHLWCSEIKFLFSSENNSIIECYFTSSGIAYGYLNRTMLPSAFGD